MYIIGHVPHEWLDAVVDRMNNRYVFCDFNGVDGDTVVAKNIPGPHTLLLIQAYLHGVNDAPSIYGI